MAIAALTMSALGGCEARHDLGPVADAKAAARIRTALVGTGDAAATTEAAPASSGTGWATLRGRFVYDGTPPVMPPYAVNKDAATCSPDGHMPPQETLLVDGATHGIKNVVVYLRSPSRVHPSAEPKGGTVVFDQKTCTFLSHVMPMTIGQTIEIKNSDNVGHNTNISGAKNKFNQTIPAGESIAYTPQREEVTPAAVTCSIHPWMSAYVLPRENGYWAVTAADGTFEIPNVPAGEKLEVQVWHESAAGPGGGLVVDTPEARKLQWSRKGRFTVTLQPDEVKDVEVTMPAAAFRG
jgi:hypothetical protein